MRCADAAKNSIGPTMARTGKGKVRDDAPGIPLQRMIKKIDRKGIGNVVEPNHAHEPPDPRIERLMQTANREEREQVGPKNCNPEEDERRGPWRGAYLTEPGDKAEMDEML